MTVHNGDCLDILKTLPDNSVDSIVTDPPYELGFMGKHWDNTGIAYSVALWSECLRVLKPGGHLLSFGGSRTYHRMACAIEDAGFEVRDMIEWVYGSGFPKSLNIGKAVDKLQGNEREIIDNPNTRDRTKHNATTVFTSQTITGWDKSKGNTPYEGFGTALKPAHEPVCLARKPLDCKTIAENVLKHGTSGMNIDGCRVETESHIVHGKEAGNFQPCGGQTQKDYHAVSGRFPANLIHDGSDEVLAVFPDSKGFFRPNCKDKSYEGASFGGGQVSQQYNDNGSASRFFYCAKASKSERDAGCENLDLKQYSHDGRETPIENAYQRNDSVSRNYHPTIKPIALMRYLCRLITPPNGIVLDPFMGSGTTGCACALEGFDFIGIEREADYVKIAEARIKYWSESKQQQEIEI